MTNEKAFYTPSYRDELALTRHFVAVLEQKLAGRDMPRRTNTHPLDWCHLGVLGPAKLVPVPVDLDAAQLEAEATEASANGAAAATSASAESNATLLDRTSISTIGDVAAMLRRRGDDAGALDIETALRKARELMGISEIRVVNDFPLALCAYGYTRTSRDPGRTVITPFPLDERGKIPVFAISSETEALWFQLDPQRVVAWLIENGLAGAAAPATAEDAWSWLYAEIPGLREAPHEPAYQQREAVAVRTLLHTMSHLFLRRIEWSGFAPSSVGEYLIPASLSFILYANRYAETKSAA